ncbi:MAG: hypothetical protein EP340_08075 [Alphaproteobacteria bacterium]|nr:MAG: hypothetical protein EP340_08075 [Alphaproteobacteria bacterium]
MKRISTLLAGAALLGLTTALPASADDDGEHSCSPRERMQQRFTEVDINKDGKISAEERDAAKQKRFDEIDTNHNGKVTAKEMEAHHQAKEAERRKARFDEMDKDGNGTLSVDELEGGKGDRFAGADADKDGYVTKEEMKKAHHDRQGDRHERWRDHRKGDHERDFDCKVD